MLEDKAIHTWTPYEAGSYSFKHCSPLLTDEVFQRPGLPCSHKSHLHGLLNHPIIKSGLQCVL
jgi:hypothetical protein